MTTATGDNNRFTMEADLILLAGKRAKLNDKQIADQLFKRVGLDFRTKQHIISQRWYQVIKPILQEAIQKEGTIPSFREILFAKINY